MPHFRAELTFPFPLERVFRFHARPENLADMAPPGAEVTVVERPSSLIVGAELELKIGLYGMSQNVRLRIVDVDEPRLLVDEQVKGPFQKWRQRHLFTRTPDGGTHLTYEVEFEPPKGMLGFVITADRVLDGLQSAMPAREKRTREMLAAEAS
ncbi:MAG TPA: SRPBCC family protein [Pirellulales bacterium]